MTDNKELEEALLLWINTFHPSSPVRSWEDMQDGHNFWTTLTRIAPTSFSGSLPELVPSDNWIRRWQNLKHVDRAVTAFIRDECGRMQNWTGRAKVDLKAIAIDKSVAETVRLAQSVLLAAVYSPDFNQQLISTMETLGPQVSKPIAACVEAMIALDNRLSDKRVRPELGMSPRSSSPVESDLKQGNDWTAEIEQSASPRGRSGRMAEEIRHRRRRITQLENRSAELIKEPSQLGEGSPSNNILRRMRERSESDIDQIATLENNLDNARALAVQQTQRIESLSKEIDLKNQLVDQLDYLQAERDELAQKLQVAERMSDQLRNTQFDENSLETSRMEYEILVAQLEGLKDLKERNTDLEEAYRESLNTIRSSEAALLGEVALREQLERDVKRLTQSLKTVTLRQQGDIELSDANGLETDQEGVLKAFGDLGEEIEEAINSDNKSKILKAFGSLGDEIEANESVKYTLLAKNARLSTELARIQAVEQERNKQLIPDDVGSIESEEDIDNAMTSDTTSRESISQRASQTNNTILQLIEEGRNALKHQDDKAEEPSDLEEMKIDDTKNIEIAEHTGAYSKRKSGDILQRELQLMTNAWYNLTRRMQSDAVVVQRRREAPKSFLNKQRKLLRGPKPGVL